MWTKDRPRPFLVIQESSLRRLGSFKQYCTGNVSGAMVLLKCSTMFKKVVMENTHNVVRFLPVTEEE